MIGDGWLKCPGHRQGTSRRACILPNLTPPLPLPASRAGASSLGRTGTDGQKFMAPTRRECDSSSRRDAVRADGLRQRRRGAESLAEMLRPWIIPAIALRSTQTRLKLEVSTCDPPSPPELPRPTFRLAEQESCKSRGRAANGELHVELSPRSHPHGDPAGLDYPNFHHSCQRPPDSPCF